MGGISTTIFLGQETKTPLKRKPVQTCRPKLERSPETQCPYARDPQKPGPVSRARGEGSLSSSLGGKPQEYRGANLDPQAWETSPSSGTQGGLFQRGGREGTGLGSAGGQLLEPGSQGVGGTLPKA